jgi:hypothetical protein
MSMCEKCWSEAESIARSNGTSKSDEYRRLRDERSCSPEEQAP